MSKKVLLFKEFDFNTKRARLQEGLTLANNVLSEINKLGVVQIESLDQIRKAIANGGEAFVLSEIEKQHAGVEVSGLKLNGKRFAEIVDIGNPAPLNAVCRKAMEFFERDYFQGFQYFVLKGNAVTLPAVSLDKLKTDSTMFAKSESQEKLAEIYPKFAELANEMHQCLIECRGYGINRRTTFFEFLSVGDFGETYELKPVDRFWESNEGAFAQHLSKQQNRK